jgi:hypothetical protein
MMASEQELLELIGKLVEEKTFSLEGAKAIASLKSSVQANNAKLKEYEVKVDLYVKDNERCRAQVKALNDTIEEYKKREEEIKKRENYLSQQDLRMAVAEARSNVMDNVFQTIFKNTIIRENIQKKVSAELPVQYAGQVPTTILKDAEQETKTSSTE